MQKRNALVVFLLGAILGWITTATLAIVQHHSLLFTLIVGPCDLVFLVLYVRRSRYAWHVAMCNVIGFGIYHLSYWRHPNTDIIIVTVLAAYLIVNYRPYIDYVRDHTGGEKT